MSIIELKNITYSYDEKEVLKGFSLDIKTGETTCLLGSSGCGKTTILRLIAGLETPQEGSVIIDNQKVSAANKILIPANKRAIGFVFQDLALWPHFTVYKNVAFGLSGEEGAVVKKRTHEILDFFDLHAHAGKYPHQLSGGQQQLLAIARSLVLKPKILLMDEPLANLDVKLKSKMLSYINDIKKQFNITIVYVTHDHREAFLVSDNIIVLNKGKIEDIGSVEDIKKSENEYVKYFIEYLDLNKNL